MNELELEPLLETYATDPPVPADGSCAVCGGERRLNQSLRYRTHAELDPFCSTECCRAWYAGLEERST